MSPTFACGDSNIGDDSSHDLSSTTCVVTGGLGFIGSNSPTMIRRGAPCDLDGLIEVTEAPPHVRRTRCRDRRSRDRRQRRGRVVAYADVIFNLAVSQPPRRCTTTSRSPSQRRHPRLVPGIVRSTIRRLGRAHIDSAVYAATSIPVDELHPTRPMANGSPSWPVNNFPRVHRPIPCRDKSATDQCLRTAQRLRATSWVLAGFHPQACGEEILIFARWARRDCVYVADVVEALLAATAPSGRQGLQRGQCHRPLLAEIAARSSTRPERRGCRSCRGRDHQRIDIGSFHTDAHHRRVLGEGDHGTRYAFGDRDLLSCHPWYLSST